MQLSQRVVKRDMQLIAEKTLNVDDELTGLLAQTAAVSQLDARLAA